MSEPTTEEIDALAEFLALRTALATRDPDSASVIARRVLEGGWRKPAEHPGQEHTQHAILAAARDLALDRETTENWLSAWHAFAVATDMAAFAANLKGVSSEQLRRVNRIAYGARW